MIADAELEILIGQVPLFCDSNGCGNGFCYFHQKQVRWEQDSRER